MTLSYDPEFIASIAPFQETLSSRSKLAVGDITGRREVAKRTFAELLPVGIDIPSVTRMNHTVQREDGASITVAEFCKQGSPRPTKAIFYAHGGGMIRGSVDAFEAVIKTRCDLTGVPIFAVDYRLAPEHPFPTPVEDCFAALQWLYEHATALSVPKDRIVIMGESAGGGLAAGVALMARDRKLSPPLAKQILIFPMLDDRNLTPLPVIEPLATWTCDDNITGWKALLGERAGDPNFEAVSAYAAPARATSLEGLPPTYIECGQLDIFSFENVRYASRLLDARVPTELHIYPGQPHGFMMLAPNSRYSKMSTSNVLAAINAV